MTYELKVAGLTRQLKLSSISDDLMIAGFVVFGDVELTVACARELLKVMPEYDYIIAPEAKAIPLIHEVARQNGRNEYLLARKAAKAAPQGDAPKKGKGKSGKSKHPGRNEAEDI
mgnify:CR=1 FL=1